MINTLYGCLVDGWIFSKYGFYPVSEKSARLFPSGFPEVWYYEGTPYIRGIKDEYWGEFEAWCKKEGKEIPPPEKRKTLLSMTVWRGNKALTLIPGN